MQRKNFTTEVWDQLKELFLLEQGTFCLGLFGLTRSMCSNLFPFMHLYMYVCM